MKISFEQLEELNEACKPLLDWLNKIKADPYMSIVVDKEGAKVVRTEAFTPSRNIN